VAAHTAAKKHSLTRKIQRKINPRMIDDYIIVKQSKTERIDDIHKFERAVIRKLADGYILQGGICIHKDGYYQALTKRKLESNSKSTNNGAGVDLLNDVSPELLKLGED
jgi:hypothetical protein